MEVVYFTVRFSFFTWMLASCSLLVNKCKTLQMWPLMFQQWSCWLHLCCAGGDRAATSPFRSWAHSDFCSRREVSRQIECLLSSPFSSWLLVLFQPRVGQSLWQQPLGWGMTGNSGPTFRLRAEHILDTRSSRGDVLYKQILYWYCPLRSRPSTPNFDSLDKVWPALIQTSVRRARSRDSFLTSQPFHLCDELFPGHSDSP